MKWLQLIYPVIRAFVIIMAITGVVLVAMLAAHIAAIQRAAGG